MKNYLTAYECWKKANAENLTDSEYKDLLIKNKIIINNAIEVSKTDAPNENNLWIEANRLYNLKDHTQDGRNLQMEHFIIIPRKNAVGREFTGVYTRDGYQICVGDKVDTVQGTVFEVVKLEHLNGIKYALHDGQRPYDLEPFMSPNLWLVGNDG